jgi:hypothetical protein
MPEIIGNRGNLASKYLTRQIHAQKEALVA